MFVAPPEKLLELAARATPGGAGGIFQAALVALDEAKNEQPDAELEEVQRGGEVYSHSTLGCGCEVSQPRLGSWEKA